MFNYTNWRGGRFAAPVLIGQTTNIQLAAGSLSGAPAAPFVVVFCSDVVDANGFRTERESVLVTARTDDLITTCTRAYESGTGGGVARAWTTDDSCLNLITAAMFSDVVSEVTDIVAAVDTAGIMPVGSIVMWSGAIAAIPTHWALCDGTNNTPDLRDKFVIGARQDDGGIAKTNVEESLTLSGGDKDAIVVSHAHTASQVAHNHTATDSGHTHGYSHVGGTGTSIGGGSFYIVDDPATTSSGTADITVENATPDITVDYAGSSGTNKRLPPYYALAFIQRIS